MIGQILMNFIMKRGCDHTRIDENFEAKIRKGSKIATWAPEGLPMGIIETNPDYPPRLHRLCGCPAEELKSVVAEEALWLK